MATASAVKPAPRKQPSALRVIRTVLGRSPELGALIGLVFVVLFFALRVSDTFLTGDSVASILSGRAIPGIVVVGVAFLMISGEFDLSVGSTLAVCALVFLSLIQQNVPIILAAVVAVLAGLGLGLINGLILVWTRIPSFIVTLGTLQIYRAIALTSISGGGILRYADYSNKPPMIYVHPLVIIALMLGVFVALFFGRSIIVKALQRSQKNAGVKRLFSTVVLALLILIGVLVALIAGAVLFNQLSNLTTLVEIDFFALLNGQIRGGWITGILDPIARSDFRMGILWWVIIVGIFTILLVQTRYGSATYATGGNAGAARAQGIRVDRVRIINFMICGGLAGFAGVLETARVQSVFPNTATGLELEAITSAVIGGTLLAGGYGTIIGALIGTLITGVLQTGLVLLNVPAELFRGVIGIFLIVTVILNTLVRRAR